MEQNNKIKYMPRIIDSLIERYIKVAGAISIEGPKWCGKTRTSEHHSKSFFYVGDPSNNFSNRSIAEINPTFVLQGESPRMIDEWQEVPLLWDAVRSDVDKKSEKGLFILTGSSTPNKKGILHSGAGRIISVRMDTMTLYETGDSKGSISLKNLCNGQLENKFYDDVSIDKIAYYIVRGGWPNNLGVSADDANIMPKSYMEKVEQEDISRMDENISFDSHKMKLVLKSLARNESTTASVLSIANDISENDNCSVNRLTIDKYLDILNRLYLFNNIEPFSPNVRSSLRVKQMEKRHFADSAMACAMLNLTPSKLLNDLNTFGLMFEALVEHDLRIYAQSFNAKLYHYQDYKDNEIDAVIELEDGQWCAFEIKLGANRIEEAASNLNKIENEIIKNGGKGPKIKCVICGINNAAYQRNDGVYVIPFTELKN